MTHEHTHKQIICGIKPGGMSKMLFEYVGFVRELDKILETLTRGKCPTNGINCDPDFGCCIKDAHLIGATEEMELYQRLEGRIQDFDRRRCKYHDKKCTLRDFMPPLCLTHLCTDLEDYLVFGYGLNGLELVEAMANASDSCDSMVNGDMGRTLFSNMEKAISAGKKIINEYVEGRR